ncbi:Hypothetical predicted protein [Podarcis lilfordi]|uniref:Uncharacterized protein n=1 Tax=Podarcis lilfordi TaxID=74358 RepID=A0AA35JRK4_9SAUR|nr:Hypothetical predicted protein [Podarcis lilfordi]
MDPKRRLDQNSGTNEQISGVKGGTPSETPEERNNEMSKHQETPGLPGSKAGNNTTSVRKYSCQQPVSQGFPRSHPSIGHHCLQSSKTLQVPSTNEASAKDTKPLLSPRTGKELHSNFNQTSPHWDKKPLAEVLSPSSNKRQVNKDAERDGRGAKEGTAPPGGSEPEESSLYKLVPSFQFLVGQDCESGSQPPAGAEYKYRNQSPERNRAYPPQQSKKAKTEEGAVWICPRTGKELRCSATQTTFFWDGKTLSEYLHSTGRKASGPEIKQLLQAFPSSHQQPADQESQQSSQQSIEQRYLQSKTTKQLQQRK